MYLRTRSAVQGFLPSLIGSTVLTITWICQVSFWTNCEELPRDDNGVQQYCPQFAMRKSQNSLNSGVQRAKFALGWIIAFGYLGYLALIASALAKTRKMKARSKDGGKDFQKIID